MKYVGYIVIDRTSPREKMHAMFAFEDGTILTQWGPTVDGKGDPIDLRKWGNQRKQTRAANAAAAARSLVEAHEKKREAGYTDSAFVTGDVTDVTDVTDAMVDARTHAIPHGSVHVAVTAFSRAVGGAAPAVAAPTQPAVRVDERAEVLRLPVGEVVVRPNGEAYLPRDLGGHTDVAVLRTARAAGLYALLSGLPGTGKTALADGAFPDLIPVQCHGDMTVAHLVGTHMPTPDGGWRWEDGPLTTAMRQGRVVLLDEIDKMPAEVSAVLHSAMDGRRMIRLDDRPDTQTVTAADGFYVIGTYNPDALGRATLTEAITSRFTLPVTVTTDYAAARSLGVPGALVTAAENLTTRAREEQASGGRGVWAPQMRELLAAKRLADAGMGLPFAAAAMLAQCPHPEDLPTVTDVYSRALGAPITPLTLGTQV